MPGPELHLHLNSDLAIYRDFAINSFKANNKNAVCTLTTSGANKTVSISDPNAANKSANAPSASVKNNAPDKKILSSTKTRTRSNSVRIPNAGNLKQPQSDFSRPRSNSVHLPKTGTSNNKAAQKQPLPDFTRPRSNSVNIPKGGKQEQPLSDFTRPRSNSVRIPNAGNVNNQPVQEQPKQVVSKANSAPQNSNANNQPVQEQPKQVESKANSAPQNSNVNNQPFQEKSAPAQAKAPELTEAQRAQNNRTRSDFYNAIVRHYGSQNNIPASVKEALQLNNFDLKQNEDGTFEAQSGRELNASRIMDVLLAMDKEAATDPKLFAKDLVGELQSVNDLKNYDEDIKGLLVKSQACFAFDKLFPDSYFSEVTPDIYKEIVGSEPPEDKNACAKELAKKLLGKINDVAEKFCKNDDSWKELLGDILFTATLVKPNDNHSQWCKKISDELNTKYKDADLQLDKAQEEAEQRNIFRQGNAQPAQQSVLNNILQQDAQEQIPPQDAEDEKFEIVINPDLANKSEEVNAAKNNSIQESFDKQVEENNQPQNEIPENNAEDEKFEIVINSEIADQSVEANADKNNSIQESFDERVDENIQPQIEINNDDVKDDEFEIEINPKLANQSEDDEFEIEINPKLANQSVDDEFKIEINSEIVNQSEEFNADKNNSIQDDFDNISEINNVSVASNSNSSEANRVSMNNVENEDNEQEIHLEDSNVDMDNSLEEILDALVEENNQPQSKVSNSIVENPADSSSALKDTEVITFPDVVDNPILAAANLHVNIHKLVSSKLSEDEKNKAIVNYLEKTIDEIFLKGRTEEKDNNKVYEERVRKEFDNLKDPAKMFIEGKNKEASQALAALLGTCYQYLLIANSQPSGKDELKLVRFINSIGR